MEKRTFTKWSGWIPPGLVGLMLFFFVSVSLAQTVNSNFRDGAVFFKLKDNAKVFFSVNADNSVDKKYLSFLSDVYAKYNIKKVTRPFDFNNDFKLLRTFLIEFSDIYNIDYLVQDLAKNPDIEYAEKVARRYPLWHPNDPLYNASGPSYPGYLTSVNWSWHLDQVYAEQAWDIAQGSASVKVAVVDNAVWGAHPDLSIASTNQYNAVTGTVGNASPPSSVSQTACADPNNCPAYEWSHGTHSAGNVGAKNNNNVGVCSLGGGVTVLGVRVADDNGQMWSNYTAAGIQWAAQQGAKVISLSLGGFTPQTTEQNLMNSLFNSGITVVAAAGNNGDGAQDPNNVNAISYPAGYQNVISVAATDDNKKLSTFSEYGSWIDVAAPGGFFNSQFYISELSTTYVQNTMTKYVFTQMGLTNPITGNYDVMQGTSMSCPIVASLCGLMLSLNPALTPTQILNCLQSNMTTLASGSNPISTGHGIINAQAVMQCVQASAGAPTVTTASISAITNTTASTGGNVTAQGTSTVTARGVCYATTQNPTTSNSTVASGSGTGSFTANLTGLILGTTYYVRAYATNSSGTAYGNQVSFTTTGGTTPACDTLMLTTSGLGWGSYANGNNSYGDKAKANYFAGLTAGQTVQDVYVQFILAKGTTQTASCAIWNNSGTGGSPGSTPLATKTATLSSIATDITNQTLTLFHFTNPVTLTGPGYIGIILPTAAGDTVVLAADTSATPSYNVAWEQWSDNVWYAYNAPGSWGINAALAVYPVTCSPSTDIQVNKAGEIKSVRIFPNPSQNTVFCDPGGTNINDAGISVFNMLGKQVAVPVNIEAEKLMELDFSTLPDGFYLIQVNTSEGNFVRKVLINR